MKTPPDAIKELLLEDYRYRAESMKNSEQSGETRLNIFIGVVTLFAAGIVTFVTSESGPAAQTVYLLALVAIGVLLVLGVVTLFRLLIRNENTDKCKRDLDHIRQMFKDHFDESGQLIDYYPVGRPKLDARDEDEITNALEQVEKDTKRGFGGLAHMMAAINSMLLAGGVVLAHLLLGGRWLTAPTWVYVLLMAALLGGSFFIQLLYVAHRELSWSAKIKKTLPTHAGAVVYKCENEIVKYLLIITEEPDLPDKETWVLPKGKIKPGEGHVEAALREIQEESGVVVKFVCPLGFVKYTDKKDKTVRAKYYLMEYLFDSPLPSEGRLSKWLQFTAATQLLEHDEGKHLLELAAGKLDNRCTEADGKSHKS